MTHSPVISSLTRLGDQEPVKSLIRTDFLISLQIGKAIAVGMKAPTC